MESRRLLTFRQNTADFVATLATLFALLTRCIALEAVVAPFEVENATLEKTKLANRQRLEIRNSHLSTIPIGGMSIPVSARSIRRVLVAVLHNGAIVVVQHQNALKEKRNGTGKP
jgi:hypothetical protein